MKTYERKTIDCFGCDKRVSLDKVWYCPCGNPFCEKCAPEIENCLDDDESSEDDSTREDC